MVATLGKVHERLNIPDSVIAPDTKIASYILEADGYVDTQTAIHATTPVSADNELNGLANALAAAIYRFYTSQDHLYKPVEAARKDIQEYIKARYGRTNTSGLGQKDSFGVADGNVTGLET